MEAGFPPGKWQNAPIRSLAFVTYPCYALFRKKTHSQREADTQPAMTVILELVDFSSSRGGCELLIAVVFILLEFSLHLFVI